MALEIVNHESRALAPVPLPTVSSLYRSSLIVAKDGHSRARSGEKGATGEDRGEMFWKEFRQARPTRLQMTLELPGKAVCSLTVPAPPS